MKYTNRLIAKAEPDTKIYIAPGDVEGHRG